MIKPIYLLGEDVLRKQTEDIEQDSTELQTLIDDMLETMADAKGIGLAKSIAQGPSNPADTIEIVEPLPSIELEPIN